MTLPPRYVPATVRTPTARPFSTRTAVTASRMTVAPAAYRSRAPAMSWALSDTGNTRRPRSVFRWTPRPSKKAMVSWGEKAESAP